MRCEPVDAYKKAVIGIDFTAFSLQAIMQAAQVAPAASLHLVHAFHVPFKGRFGEDFADDVAHVQRLEFDAFIDKEMKALEQRAASVEGLAHRFQRTLEEGEPGKVLRATRSRMDCDLLVIATHGRGALSRAIWGSVAVDLLSDPPCDVLVIKPC